MQVLNYIYEQSKTSPLIAAGLQHKVLKISAEKYRKSCILRGIFLLARKKKVAVCQRSIDEKPKELVLDRKQI